MSTRTTLRPYSVITNVSMAADITSSVTVLQSLTSVAYTVYWSGTSPVGTVSVEVSNDYALSANAETVATAGHWVAVALTDDTGAVVTSIAISGNTGTKFINVTKIAGYAIRLKYTYGSGVGTMNAVVCGKVS